MAPLARTLDVASAVSAATCRASLDDGVGERREADVEPAPSGVLQGRAFAPAPGASRRASQHIARRVGPPSNDEGHDCHGRAVQTGVVSRSGAATSTRTA